MNAIYHALAVLAAWLGLGLLIAPFIGWLCKDRLDRRYSVRRKQT